MAHGAAVWLPFVQPFATLLLGMAASAVAYRQWLTANEKLKLDLYDKRSSCLDDATKDYMEIFRHGFQDQDSLRRLYYQLGRMETVFMGRTRSMIISIREDVGSAIGTRETARNLDELSDTFDRIVDRMPKLQKLASVDMQINVR